MTGHTRPPRPGAKNRGRKGPHLAQLLTARFACGECGAQMLDAVGSAVIDLWTLRDMAEPSLYCPGCTRSYYVTAPVLELLHPLASSIGAARGARLATDPTDGTLPIHPSSAELAAMTRVLTLGLELPEPGPEPLRPSSLPPRIRALHEFRDTTVPAGYDPDEVQSPSIRPEDER